MGIKHDTVGTRLTQAEWEVADSHHITDLIPEADDTYDLGSATYAWQDLFLEGDITMTDAGTIATSAGALTINGTAGINLQEGGSTIIGISDARVISVGADDAGFDVIFYGDTASANMTWDTSADDLILNGGAGLIVPDGQLTLGSVAITATATEINTAADGNTSIGTTTVSDGHGIVMNHGGTMAQTTVQTLSAYLDDEITAMPNLTSVGTLTTLTIDNIIINGTNIGHTSDTDAIAIASDGVVTMNQIPVFSAGINVSGGSIAGTLSTAAQTNITSLGTLTALQVDYANLNASTLKITDSSDTGDYASLEVTTHGATTLTTVDDDDAAAHLVFDVDGNITLDADAGTITFSDAGSSLGTITSSGYSGNAATATALATARAINGVNFDGTAAITVTAAGSTLSDTVPVSKGGTNATSLADKAVLITQDSGTDTVATAAMSTNGQLLIGGTSGPAVATLTAGTGISISNSDGGVTVTNTVSDTNTTYTAGTLLDLSSTTFNVDLSEASAATTMAQTDEFIILDNDDSSAAKRESLQDVLDTVAGTVATTGLDRSGATLVVSDLHPVGVDGSANQLLTDDGDGTVTSESGLSFTGTALSLTGNIVASGTSDHQGLIVTPPIQQQMML